VEEVKTMVLLDLSTEYKGLLRGLSITGQDSKVDVNGKLRQKSSLF
jgi:hypothetical protein